MSGTAGLVVAPAARLYDHGPAHPLRPERVLLTWDLLEAYGVTTAVGVQRLDADPALDPALLLVHTPEYLEATPIARTLRSPDRVSRGAARDAAERPSPWT